MFVPKEMKCNRLVQVDIPRGGKIYKMNPYGCSLPPASSYTGDNPAEFSRNKIQELSDIEAYDAMKQREEFEKSEDSK